MSLRCVEKGVLAPNVQYVPKVCRDRGAVHYVSNVCRDRGHSTTCSICPSVCREGVLAPYAQYVPKVRRPVSKIVLHSFVDPALGTREAMNEGSRSDIGLVTY